MTPTVAIQGIPQRQASPSVETQSKLHVDADESEPTYEKTEIRFSFGSRSNLQDDVNKPEPTTHPETPNLASFPESQLHSQDLHKPDKTASSAAEVHPTPESVRTHWQSGRTVQSISPEQLSPDDVVIAYVSFTSSPGAHDMYSLFTVSWVLVEQERALCVRIEIRTTTPNFRSVSVH
jgi:hypothetical protein